MKSKQTTNFNQPTNLLSTHIIFLVKEKKSLNNINEIAFHKKRQYI